MTNHTKSDYFLWTLFVLVGILTFYVPFFLVAVPDIKLLMNRVPVDIKIYTEAQDGQTKLWSCNNPFIDNDTSTWFNSHSGFGTAQITSVHDNWSSTGIELQVSPSEYCAHINSHISYIPNENKYLCDNCYKLSPSPRLIMADTGSDFILIFIAGGFLGFNIAGPIVGTVMLIHMMYQDCRSNREGGNGNSGGIELGNNKTFGGDIELDDNKTL